MLHSHITHLIPILLFSSCIATVATSRFILSTSPLPPFALTPELALLIPSLPRSPLSAAPSVPEAPSKFALNRSLLEDPDRAIVADAFVMLFATEEESALRALTMVFCLWEARRVTKFTEGGVALREEESPLGE